MSDTRIRRLERAAALGDVDAAAALEREERRAYPLGPRLWPVFRVGRGRWHVPRVYLDVGPGDASGLWSGYRWPASRCGRVGWGANAKWSLSAPVNDGERVEILPACESCARRPLDLDGWALAVTWLYLREPHLSWKDQPPGGAMLTRLDPRRLAEALNRVLGMALDQSVHVDGLHLAAGDAMRALA
jgi:hypothetical protein